VLASPWDSECGLVLACCTSSILVASGSLSSVTTIQARMSNGFEGLNEWCCISRGIIYSAVI
jgi:hypothetical protein